VQESEPWTEKKPVELEGEDPELFQSYLNCVYFGSETLEQWADAAKVEAHSEGNTREQKQAVADSLFSKLVRMYLLAERLVDSKTANIASGEIIRSVDRLGCIPTQAPISLAYACSTRESPLRNLLRDFWIYESFSYGTSRERLRTSGFPPDFVQDIAIEMLRVASGDVLELTRTVEDICSIDECHYHQHDELHPQCDDVESGMCLVIVC
jgi:hypothetical protein